MPRRSQNRRPPKSHRPALASPLRDADFAMLADEADLADWCAALPQRTVVAFDTEFVSEDCYQPELCLVQLAWLDEQGETRLAVLDPLPIRDLLPLWETLAAAGRELVIHSGRQELVFFLQALGRRPAELFDVQLASGLIGLEYPAGYSSLVGKLLGAGLHKGETRTDWRRRPLTTRQVQYALDDVRHLIPLRNEIIARLEQLGRRDWLREEMGHWQDEVEASLTRDRWRRVAGAGGLAPRELAVVRELWQWRDEQAQRANRPARFMLRDDLIVEMARRKTADEHRMGAIRGMEHRNVKRAMPELAACVRRALELPEEELPDRFAGEPITSRPVLGQFLAAVLASVCREKDVAPALLGGPNEVREFIGWRLGERRQSPPPLAVGWRAEVVGKLLDQMLAGEMAVRVRDPQGESPLAVE